MRAAFCATFWYRTHARTVRDDMKQACSSLYTVGAIALWSVTQGPEVL